jgi:type III secretion system YscI/HrpB-like protein
MGLMQISVQHELVAKGISRSTQNLDQLVKIQ